LPLQNVPSSQGSSVRTHFQVFGTNAEKPELFWAQAFYKSCRARGMRHQAALGALAFKWIRIIHRCWVERKPYDEFKYLLALQKRQGPLLNFAAATPD
jgi:hypothetical protein